MLNIETEKLLRCGGIILLNSNFTEPSIVLVETRQKRFNLSFPKGKREVGEDILTTAKREMLEETGISSDKYEFVHDLYYIEYLFSNFLSKPHIIYFVARVKENVEIDFIPQDTKEIVSASWFSIKNILNDDNVKSKLTNQRRQIVIKLDKSSKKF